MLALAIGTVLAVGALAFVLFPLLAGAGAIPTRSRVATERSSASAEQDAVVALREIEFDRVTGKLSDSDYDELRARYTQHALDAMRAAPPDDPAEAAVRAYRARLKECVTCGPRPEPDAIFCSHCGSYLPGACASCGTMVGEMGATFCASCGTSLAA